MQLKSHMQSQLQSNHAAEEPSAEPASANDATAGHDGIAFPDMGHGGVDIPEAVHNKGDGDEEDEEDLGAPTWPIEADWMRHFN